MEAAKLRRHTDRGLYDLDSVKSVFEDCFVAHVSYVDDGLPACIPMIALVREEDEEEDGEGNGRSTDGSDGVAKKAAVWLHGHPSSRLMELVRKASRDNEDGTEPALPPVKVCITATKVDGLVLSSAPNGHAFNYRSAVIHGTCSPVHDKPLKRKVMRAVTNHIVANRWDEVNPVASFQVSLVYVIKVDIDSMSVKSRKGVPGIQPRNKEADGPDHDTPPWTGVIPVWDQLGSPVESGLTPGAKVSKNLEEFMKRRNEKHKSHAESVAR